ncbi:uncharacterized protein [Littorina saxatilis]
MTEIRIIPNELRARREAAERESEAELCWDEGESRLELILLVSYIMVVCTSEERAPKEAQNQRKSVGRMDDGFMKTFPPVISHQQNNFKPNQETNISGKDSGTGGKAQRWQWEGMESNSRKTDDRNILVMTAARGMEEVCPISSPFSLKNRGQKQGNGEDNVKKQTLILLTTGTVSRSPVGHETGRVDIYAGDKNLLNAGFRKEHSIHDIIAMQQISVPCDAANDSDVKFLVRMRPYGEGKDSWEHCTTQDGDVGLPEEQPLYISQILRGSSTFPASATWVLETPDKCTPSSTLEAVLEINMVTGDSMVPSNGSSVTSGNPVAQLSIQVQGKELHDAVPDLERSDRQQSGITLEEKYQTEPMEK